MSRLGIAMVAMLTAACGFPDEEIYEGPPRCGLSADAGLRHIELRVRGRTRDFELFVPDQYDPDEPTSLVFAWHGRDGNGRLAREYFGIEEAAAGAAIIAYPNGRPVATMGGQTGWDLRPDGYDMDFFDAIRGRIYSSYCIDEERVFSTGHSFGGYMTHALGCFRPEVLRAIAPVSGGPAFDTCEPGRVAAIAMHGDRDEVVPFAEGVKARDDLVARNGCDATTTAVEPEPCVAYGGCDPGYDVRWCEHSSEELMGHMWPDFAGAAIWSFFAGLAPEPST